jgi:hypothetical protein
MFGVSQFMRKPWRGPDEDNREERYRLALLRKEAPLMSLMSIAVLAATLFFHVPTPLFGAACAAFGVGIYSLWASATVRAHSYWAFAALAIVLVPVVVGQASGTDRAVSTLQSITAMFGSLSLCFWIERYVRRG